MSEAKKAMYRARQSKLSAPQKKQVKAYIKGAQITKFQEVNGNTAGLAVPFTGLIYQLSIIAQGDTAFTRDGDKIILKHLQIRGNVYCGDYTNLVRLILFQWRPVTTPTIPDVLNLGANGTTVDPYSFYNEQKKTQFKILYDKTHDLAGDGAASTSPYGPATSKYFQIKISNKLIKKLDYAGGSSTVGSNQVWYIALSDSIASPNPSLTLKCRFTYSDG